MSVQYKTMFQVRSTFRVGDLVYMRGEEVPAEEVPPSFLNHNYGVQISRKIPAKKVEPVLLSKKAEKDVPASEVEGDEIG